jgi:organic radical activating enzyme
MAKNRDESYRQYRDRVVDPISGSFCGAKWYNATIWLNNGTTTSCHHPPAHKIIDFEAGETFDDLKKNPSLIHNTTYKKNVRKQMLIGERPKECEYCWKIEDLGQDKISDRVFKSVIYTDQELEECRDKWAETEDVDLKTLEIAFDSNCNFACSYCNASFSTTWQKDIRQNGAYQNLHSDGARAFQQDGGWTKQFKKNEVNPYTEAFWDWWPKLSKSLDQLRVTGGDPPMSPDFWKLVDWWKENGNDLDMKFAVNSNMGHKGKTMDKFVECSHIFKKFIVYTSNESTFKQAEYIRDGLEWDYWKESVNRLLQEGSVQELHVMMTINSLCLFSITDFMDYCNTLKRKYGNMYGVCSVNILRFPSFQSPGTLPLAIRQERADHIERWLNENRDGGLMHDMEIDGVERLVEYLRSVDEPHRYTSSLDSRHKDFKSFYMQYDKRRGKNFVDAFPELADWYESLPFAESIPILQLFDGDSSKGTADRRELENRAKTDEWKNQNTNPGAREYKEKKHNIVALSSMDHAALVVIYRQVSVEQLNADWEKSELIEEILREQEK